jgi:hypothetical protein
VDTEKATKTGEAEFVEHNATKDDATTLRSANATSAHANNAVLTDVTPGSHPYQGLSKLPNVDVELRHLKITLPDAWKQRPND